MTYSQDLRNKIEELVTSQNEMKISMAEIRISVTSRLALLEEQAKEQKKQAEERPDRTWSRIGTYAAILGIVISNVISVLAYVHPH